MRMYAAQQTHRERIFTLGARQDNIRQLELAFPHPFPFFFLPSLHGLPLCLRIESNRLEYLSRSLPCLALIPLIYIYTPVSVLYTTYVPT